MTTLQPSQAPSRGTDLLSRLRERTKELHTRAERHAVQSALVRGRASVGEYASYLQQLGHIHLALESELRVRLGEAVLAPVDEGQFRAGLAAADLKTLGVAGSEPPVAPVAAFAREVSALSSAELLGMQYVLEGSTNGGRFIARAVRGALPAGAQDASRYLDPYGDAQGTRWGAFCRGLLAISLTGEEQDRVIAGAEAMFRLMIETFDAMSPATA
jgi:heme oxygenase